MPPWFAARNGHFGIVTELDAINEWVRRRSGAAVKMPVFASSDLAFKDWPTAYYGAENYARLQQLKRRYDPENRIRYPQSVQLPD